MNIEKTKSNIKILLAKLDPVFRFAKFESDVMLEYTKDNKKYYTKVYSIFNDNKDKLCCKTIQGLINLEDYIDKDNEWLWSFLETHLENMVDEEESRKNS